MADLITTITEEITLPNKNIQKSTNRKVISGVNQINRRLDTITTSFSGTGIEIIRFTNSEKDQVAGSFVRDAVKYIRITNFPTSDTFASIYCIKTNQESVVFKVDPGKSLILSNDDFDASSTQDYVDETYGDQQYFADFVYMNEIKAKAGNNNATYTGSIQIEYVVASS